MRYADQAPRPPSPDTEIFRYLADWKFVNLLATFSEQASWPGHPATGTTTYYADPGQLWFAYPWSFHDTLEGALPIVNNSPEAFCDHLAEHMALTAEAAADRKRRFLAADSGVIRDCSILMAQLCGVSCWSAEGHSPDAMWNFVSSRNGVCIHSTCSRVENALTYAHGSPARQACPSVCSIDYVNHSDYCLIEDGFRSLLAIVQEQYSYEHEVRFVAKSPVLATLERSASPLDSDALPGWLRDQLRDALPANRKSAHPGFNLPLAIDKLLIDVTLKPGCDSDYAARVAADLAKAGCKGVPVR